MKKILFLWAIYTISLFCDDIENRVVDRYGNTLLHKAILDNNLTAVQIILDKDIEIDQQNFKGDSALHLAVKVNNIQIVKELIEHKATVTVYDVNHYSPLYYAKKIKNFEIVNYLKRAGAKSEFKVIEKKSILKEFIDEFNQ